MLVKYQKGVIIYVGIIIMKTKSALSIIKRFVYDVSRQNELFFIKE